MRRPKTLPFTSPAKSRVTWTAKLNQKGSAVVESMLTVPIVGFLVIGGSAILYLSFAKVWLNRAARESAICLASPSPPNRCRNKLESTLKAGLPFGQTEITVFRADRSGSKVSLLLHFDRFAKGHPKNSGHRISATAVFRKPIYFPRGRS